MSSAHNEVQNVKRVEVENRRTGQNISWQSQKLWLKVSSKKSDKEWTDVKKLRHFVAIYRFTGVIETKFNLGSGQNSCCINIVKNQFDDF